MNADDANQILICVIGVHLRPFSYRSHSFNPSTTRKTSLRFFSKSANMKMIVAPVTMPATYHSHVHPKFTDAYQIIVTIESRRKIVTMIWYASVNFGWTWLWYVAGIVTGATIIFMFALFEKKRSEVLRVVEGLKE